MFSFLWTNELKQKEGRVLLKVRQLEWLLWGLSPAGWSILWMAESTGRRGVWCGFETTLWPIRGSGRAQGPEKTVASVSSAPLQHHSVAWGRSGSYLCRAQDWCHGLWFPLSITSQHTQALHTHTHSHTLTHRHTLPFLYSSLPIMSPYMEFFFFFKKIHFHP